jgi:hypothetical protein
MHNFNRIVGLFLLNSWRISALHSSHGVLSEDPGNFQTSTNALYRVYSYRFRYQHAKTGKRVDSYVKVGTAEGSIVLKQGRQTSLTFPDKITGNVATEFRHLMLDFQTEILPRFPLMWTWFIWFQSNPTSVYVYHTELCLHRLTSTDV